MTTSGTVHYYPASGSPLKTKLARVALILSSLVIAFVIAEFIVLAFRGGTPAKAEDQWQNSVPVQWNMKVDDLPLTCVVVIGYSDYGGGISCDWAGWRKLKEGEA